LLALRAEVRKCEERVEKLTEMRGKLDVKLADPSIYDTVGNDDVARWQKKYAEVLEATDRAEALWMAALERLEQAEG
jgi:ATP-binding cassette subfamily F protein 3